MLLQVLTALLLLTTAVAADGNGTDTTIPTRRICVNGDPHYTTFDGAYYDYQSTCPYILSVPCAGDLDNGYSYFSVKAKNELQSTGDTVSFVASTEVVFGNKTIFVDKFLNVFVDGVKVYAPYYYPSQWEAQFSVVLRNNDIVIKNDQSVQVDFHYGQLCLSIPSEIPEFRGRKTLCGLAGNFDDNCEDDFMKQDGTFISSTCRPTQAETDEFADSWRTTDYMDSDAGCSDGSTMTNTSKTSCKNIEDASSGCADIFNAQMGTGPFATCSALDPDTILRFYYSCFYDLCHDKNLRCNSLADFVQTCQLTLGDPDHGGAYMQNWRHDTSCDMNCPAHSTYSACISPCPASCSDHSGLNGCDRPCSEGCACDYGYVLDTTNLTTISCIPVGECGCTDNNGNLHPASQIWLTDYCTRENYCDNGEHMSVHYSCPPNTRCGVENGEVACIAGGLATTQLPVQPTLSTKSPVTSLASTKQTHPTRSTAAPVAATDNYCKCGITDGWFDNWDPAAIWVDVIIILDTSSSMGSSLEEAKSVVTSFIELMTTDTNAEFYSRIGVIAMSDTIEVVYNLNMSSTDDLDNVQQHKIDKIDVGAAFQAALKMFADGTKTSSYRENAQQIIYYLTNSAPGSNMNGVDDFKTGGGIIIVNDFILEGDVGDPGLQKLASDNFFFTDLSDNYINSLGVFCEANCFCSPDSHPFNDDGNSPRTRANRGCFHPVNNGIPQPNARKTCEKEHGSLVSIHDSDKEFFVNSVVSVFGPKKKYWLGLQYDGAQWNWDDNSTDPFVDWDVSNGQPNTNDGKNQCAYSQQGTGFTTPWTAANCAMGGVIYVCESAPCSVGNKNCS